MNVAIIHNSYQQAGGEDQVVKAETQLLRSFGHSVYVMSRHNDDVQEMGRPELFATTMWSKEAYRELRQTIVDNDVNVVHVHNTLPLISPSVYYAALAEKVPVVQTLHNYRLVCPKAVLYRQGKICEQCLGKFLPWPALRHRCYRDDRAATGAVVAMLTLHRSLRTWASKVNTYVALTEFARRKFVEGGLPRDRIVVKPNFLPKDPGVGAGKGGYAIFVGRLATEKGINTLVEAWCRLPRDTRLKVVGDGPESSVVAQAASSDPRIEWLGWQSRHVVIDLMKDARFLVFPSEWYEGFPMTIVEAFAVGLPVVCARLGSLAHIVDHDVTGLLYEPGNVEDIVGKLTRAHDDDALISTLRKQARAKYQSHYSAEPNYNRLREIYEKALAGRGPERLRSVRKSTESMAHA